jgi:hypothetical protein
MFRCLSLASVLLVLLVGLSCGSRAEAGPYVVYSPIFAPLPVAVYSPVVPVVAYYPPAYVYPAPYYAFAPVYYGRPAVARTHFYYPGQPVRNALKVLAP